MDYPKSVPGVGLIDGRFVNEDPIAGRAGSLIPAEWGNAITDEILAVIALADMQPNEQNNAQLVEAIGRIAYDHGLASQVSFPGASSGVRMSLSAASSTASLSAAHIVLGASSAGRLHRVSDFNRSLNLGITGAGGIDTGSAPANGYVAIYAILDPATGATALLATNTTGAMAPEVYGGTNMPADYTASALVSVWPTNAARQLTVGIQQGRQISIEVKGVLSSAAQVPAATPLLIAGAVPPNAKTVSGYCALSSSVAGAGSLSVLSSATVGSQLFGPQMSTPAVAYSAPFNGLQLMTTQTIYYTATTSAGVMNAYIGISSYTI